MTPSRLALILPLVFAAHNAEEALTIAAFLPAARERLHPVAPGWVDQITPARFVAALIFVTLLGVAAGLWALARPRSRVALWALLLLQGVLLLNVISHLAAAVALRGYSPGLATALLLNLPLSLYVFRTAVGREWLPRAALIALIPAALLVHGPLLLGLLALVAWRGMR